MPSNLAKPKVHRRLVPARVELAPGLARAPKVQPLLDAAYSIVASELHHLKVASLGGASRLDGDDFKRFAVIMERLPAMLREERGGDKDAVDALKSLPDAEVKRLAAAYMAEENPGDEDEGPEATARALPQEAGEAEQE